MTYVITTGTELHIAHRQLRGLLRQPCRQSLYQGLNSKTVSSPPACVWMDSLCSSSSWHRASGRRTIFLVFPLLFLSPLWRLKTNGKKRKAGEWRKSPETQRYQRHERGREKRCVTFRGVSNVSLFTYTKRKKITLDFLQCTVHWPQY